MVVQSHPSYAGVKWKFWEKDKNNNIEQTLPENNYDSEDSLWNKIQPDTQKLQAEKTQNTDIKFHSVEIVGNNLVDTAEILQNVSIHPGDPYSVEAVQQNLKAIYDMGYFSDKMRAIPVKIDDKNIKIRIIVQENVPITDFNITGNNSVATGDLLQILDSLLNKPQNILKLNDALTEIQEY